MTASLSYFKHAWYLDDVVLAGKKHSVLRALTSQEISLHVDIAICAIM